MDDASNERSHFERKGDERTTLIYDLRHCYEIDEGSERYENGAGSAPWSTGLVDGHRPCSAKSIQSRIQTLRKERGSKRPLDNDLGRADARQPTKGRSLNVSILPLLRCSVSFYLVPQELQLYYVLREPEEGARGWREVHYSTSC